MPSRLHTTRLFLTEIAAVFALILSLSVAMITIFSGYAFPAHDYLIALALGLIGLSLFSICFRGCAMSDNHHWRMFMGIIFVLWGIDLVLPNGTVKVQFNDIITVLFVYDLFLIIYDNSSVILCGSKTCKTDKKK
ncbi:MAG: hypothetical protein PHD29_00355 [bacterium]|nr:hypothetical protein [bacterium]MDD5354746.1 hypothetical protein [bacterium]